MSNTEKNDLAELKTLLAADRQRLTMPGREALWAEISEEAGAAAGAVALRIERERPALFGEFGSMAELYVAIIGVFDSDDPEVETFEELAGALRVYAASSWLIATPLANVHGPEHLELLSEEVAIISGKSDSSDWWELRREIEAQFGVQLKLESRREHNRQHELVDTRRTAWLISVEHGTRESAQHRAKTKAEFILATWTLLSPPHHDRYMSLWPVATEWLPQPMFHIEQRSVGLDATGEDAGERGSTVIYEPDDEALYRPPEGKMLSAPLEAVKKAATHRPAARLLGAAWSLYLASRPQTELHWTDRVVFVQRAREVLCEPDPPTSGGEIRRWEALSVNLGIEGHLKERDFDERDIESVIGRSRNIRNAGIHSADGILMSLGYPPDGIRLFRDGEQVPGTELGPLHIREGIEAPYSAVHFAAIELWRRMLEADFNEEAWEKLFE